MNPDQGAGGETPQLDAVEPPGKQSPTPSKNERLSFFVVLVLLIAVIVALNWPYQYQATTNRDSGQITSPVDFQQLAPSLPVMGGWPYRYLIRYPNDAQAESTHRFSLAALIYDLIFAGLVSAAFLLYVSRRNRRLGAGKSKLSIADLLLLTLILAAPFGWWQHVERQHQQQLDFGASLQSEGASYATAAWVPAVLESRLPAKMKSKFSRVRHVRIEYPSDEMMDRLVDYPDLSTLRVGGGEYDLRLLDRLSKNPHLEDVRIAGRVMDARALQSIVSHKRLHTLNLMRTNVSVEALQLLGELPNLQRLSLIHADVDLSQLETPAWSRKIRELHLPHPGPGDEARVQIAGLAELEKLHFFCLGLKSFRVRNAPKLDFAGVAAFYKTNRAASYAPKLQPEAAKTLIDGLGESEGPALIDLDAVPLGGIDLAPLAGNRGITQLLLSQSGTELKQWKALKPMTWLTRLHVKDCPIDDAGVKWILESFPSLEHLAFTPTPGWNYRGAAAGVSQLEIVDKANLKSLDMGDDATSFFQKVRIVNAPNLQIPLTLGYVRQLEILEAPSLTGLAVHNPLPPGARLEGVGDLQFVAVGGPSVSKDGSVVAESNSCGEAIAHWTVNDDDKAMLLLSVSGRLFGGDPQLEFLSAYNLDLRFEEASLSPDGTRIGVVVDNRARVYVQEDFQIIETIDYSEALFDPHVSIAMGLSSNAWVDGDGAFYTYPNPEVGPDRNGFRMLTTIQKKSVFRGLNDGERMEEVS